MNNEEATSSMTLLPSLRSPALPLRGTPSGTASTERRQQRKT